MTTPVSKKILQQAKLVNRIAIVIDASGSMQSIHSNAVKACNTLMDTIKSNNDPNQETYVSLYTFSGNYGKRSLFVNSRPEHLYHLSDGSYTSDGGTPLFKTFNEVVDELKRNPDSNQDNTSFLVITITDGDDTDSYHRPIGQVQSNITNLQATDRWTFAFQLPPGRKTNFCRQFGIPEGNVKEWEATVAGMRDVETQTSYGINTFYTARNLGAKSLATFYAPVDMGNVKSTDLKNNLTDLRHKFKCLNVDRNNPVDGKEYQIRDFVEEKTKKTYKIGCGYYLLVKPELVQHNKEVLIVEKGKSEVWGGTEARDLIRLPHKANANVDPINTSKYDVYIQSKAVNRRLPRGTKVMVDLTKNVDDIPTWDHTKV